MRHREIPGTGISVSEIGFGADALASGWWGDHGDDDAIRLLHAALDRGITLFDTADRDGDGRVESVLGRAFADRRDRVVLATKVGYDWRAAEPTGRGRRVMAQDFRPEAIRAAVEDSLRRLGGDVIDICELHHAPRRVLTDPAVLDTLDALVTEGKVRAFGAAIAEGSRPGDGRRLIRSKRMPLLDVEISIVDHDPGAELAGLAHAAGACVIARRPHAWGLLEGKYTTHTTFPPGDPRAHLDREWLQEGLRRVDTLGFLADGRAWTLAQASLRWVLDRPGVATVIAQVHSEDQLDEFVATPELPPLEESDLARIEALIESGFIPPPEPDAGEPDEADDESATDDAAVTAAV
jgi:aryl-alcohol dehydrogenase-like predicted oxidoreductase